MAACVAGLMERLYQRIDGGGVIRIGRASDSRHGVHLGSIAGSDRGGDHVWCAFWQFGLRGRRCYR